MTELTIQGSPNGWKETAEVRTDSAKTGTKAEKGFAASLLELNQ